MNLNRGSHNDVGLAFTPVADANLDVRILRSVLYLGFRIDGIDSYFWLQPRNMKFSGFDVNYIPERSGIYEIRIFCGNIPLNGGHPFRKAVSAGTCLCF